jgi:hypothetical protein
MKMNRSILVPLAAFTLVVTPLPSCTNFRTREANAAATGGLIGAGAGAALSHDPVRGAVVGGALGAGAGYLLEQGSHGRHHHRHY